MLVGSSFNHFLKKYRLTEVSAEKMATGIARSVTGAFFGLAQIMYLQFRPLSFTICSPRKSANRLAVVIEVDFCVPYSSRVLDMLLFSQMRSISSSSASVSPFECNTSSHWF